MTASRGLPLRLAAAVVISNPEHQVLLARRSRMVDEYAGMWSFPSSFIETGTPGDQIPRIMAGKVASWLGLSLPSLELLKVRDGIRAAWRLRMYLYGAVSLQAPLLLTAKYDAVRWVDGPAFFRHCDPVTLGDCSKAYLEYLDEREKVLTR
jgi:ADP-ribose pyrophosphatase YjhB (NUDIX family)